MAATYDKIATTTIGSDTSTVTFNSIPNTYTDLKLVFNGRSNGFFGLRFNGDSGSNYSGLTHTSYGSTKSGENTTSVTYINCGKTTAGLGTGKAILVTSNINSYAGSRKKVALTEINADYSGGNGMTYYNVGAWHSTAAITSLSVYSTGSTDLIAGSNVTLYGILKA